MVQTLSNAIVTWPFFLNFMALNLLNHPCTMLRATLQN